MTDNQPYAAFLVLKLERSVDAVAD
ncbi:MAG: hypothetical protein ACI80F_002985 [Natronomonas sp.]|jgi:hypothetical protein